MRQMYSIVSMHCAFSLQVRRDLHLSKKKISDGILLRVFSHIDDDNNGGVELEVHAASPFFFVKYIYQLSPCDEFARRHNDLDHRNILSQ